MTWVCRLMDWVDSHPRTGWYVAVIVTLDFIWHIVESTTHVFQ